MFPWKKLGVPAKSGGRLADHLRPGTPLGTAKRSATGVLL